MKKKKWKKKELCSPRVIGYIRVSTEKQADKGNSLEAQQAQIYAYVAAFGLELVAIEVDSGVSAGTLERPGLQRVLERLDKFEAGGIVVTKLDRLTRSVSDLNSLIDTYFREGSHRLLSVHDHVDTATAGGRVALNIIMCVSQWERESATERTHAVLKHMKESGRYCGGFPPFGYTADDEGNLVADLAEQAIITRAKELRAAGGTLRSVIKDLGLNPRTNKPFAPTSIVRML